MDTAGPPQTQEGRATVGLAGRVARRLHAAARDGLVEAGVLPYRPGVWSRDRWRWGYESGHMDYMGELHELPRYSMLAGLLGFFGPHGDVVDLGCGQGLLRSRLPGESFERYVGVDPTPAAIERARAFEDERTTFLVGDASAVAGRRFDAVICNEVLSIVDDPAAVVREIDTLLKPGGLLLTSIWRHAGDRHLWNLLDARFHRVERVRIRSTTNDLARFGWQVGCHRAASR